MPRLKSRNRWRITVGTEPPREGFTLLEVLVACGILAFALSGIAAMLPAASARLAEAAAFDRAGVMSGNVRAELQARGVLAATWFTTGTANQKALVCGGPFKVALDAAALVPEWKVLSDSIATYDMKELWPLTGSNATRGFLSEDDLEFSSATGLLSSVYESMNPSLEPTGPRRFKSGVCWGAMVIPETLTVPAFRGMRATLAIAVFRKQPEARVLSLTSTGAKNGMFRLPDGQNTVQSSFAKSCSYLLLLPPAMNTLPPKWVRVNSSWSVGIRPFVMLSDDPNEIASYENSAVVTAIGFSSLLRVDQFPVVLE